MVLKEYEPIIEDTIEQLCNNSRFLQTTKYMQHGKTSVYEHCIKVAYMSCRIASRLRLNVDFPLLIRGALLHDYFLYDWHDKNNGHRLHGFFHPRKSLQNAHEDFELTPKEENIILRHMFPLTPIPPYYLESWIRGGNSKWWHFLFDTFKSIASMLDLRKAIINYSDLSVNKYKEIVVKYKRFFLAFPHLLILNAGILNRDVKSILRERISILNDRINSQSFV